MRKSFEESGTRAGAFGDRLRREREMRGISLDEVAATTKIGTRLLRALEDEQFELLPGGIFNKGYVRAYAKHLGIDEEQAVNDYLQAAHEPPPDVRLIAHQNASTHEDRYLAESPVSRRGFPMVPVLILLVVVAGAAGGWQLYRQRQRERRQPAETHSVAVGQANAVSQSAAIGNNAPQQSGLGLSVPASGNAAVSPEPSKVTASEDTAVHTVEAAETHPNVSSVVSGTSVPASTAVSFEVSVRARNRARVEVRSDGEVVVREVIEPSDIKTFHATRRLVFWTANAGDVELSFNGKSVPLNGIANGEQVLIFNSHGLLPRPATQ